MKPLNVLVLCECSGAVSSAFRDLGHNAYSNDIQEADRIQDRPYHIIGDCKAVLDDFADLDIVIAHPPCTAMTVAGNAHYGEGMAKYQERLEAVYWTVMLWEQCKAKAPHVALENPVSVLHRLGKLPRASYVHPWEHGHPEQKKTGLHLHNLPPLVPTDNVRETMLKLPKKEAQRIHYMSPSPERAKLRSATYPGIARAMADQWSRYVMMCNNNIEETTSC